MNDDKNGWWDMEEDLEKTQRPASPVERFVMPLFIVELYGGSQFIAPWSGDPGRTCVRASAKRYQSKHAGICALSYAKRKYPTRDFSEAQVVEA